MASISIKKDFQDGEELFAEQLNLNFATIEAGVNTANKIVWQGENGEEVVAFRGTTEEINNRNIIDGQTLYNIETGETYLDVGSERISTGAGNVVAIGEEEPTNEATKIWINPDEDSLNYQDENGAFKELVIRASDTLPIGFIGLSPSESIPYGWLLCDGSEVSRTSYADLFKVIGVTYGAGNGSTTFNLPNLKGKIPVGLDSSDNDFKNIGATGGEKKHALTVSEMPSHSHNMFVPSGSGEDTASGTAPSSNGGDSFKTWWNTYQMEKTGDGQAHNIMQPYIVQNYIIKAKQTVAVVSKTVNEYATGNDKVYDVDYINNLGVIVESGSNESGSWVKYTDGTLICRNTDFLTTLKDEGGYFQYGYWTYPISFVGDIPTIIATPKNWTGKLNNVQVNPNLINCGVLQHFMSNTLNPQLINADASPVCVVAIGRWK